MKFPFVTRTRHEEVVAALARLLYPGGIPLEFQLLLGIRIAQEEVPQPQPEPQPEEDTSADAKTYQKMKDQEKSFVAKLRAFARVSPSRLGPAIEQEMLRRKKQSAQRAHPAQSVFTAAREQVSRQ